MNQTPDPTADALPETEETEICIQCLVPNKPGTNFCRECGAPLSSYAATGPFESLFAEGHLYRRAAEQPRRFIVVLGIWLIFGGMAVSGTMIAVIGWKLGNGLRVPAGIAMVLFSVVLITKTTRNYRARQMVTGDGDGVPTASNGSSEANP